MSYKLSATCFTSVLSVIVLSCSTRPGEVAFVKHELTRDFISEGVAAGDVNNDGVIDVLAGSFWFQGPDWTRHELDAPRVFPVAEEKLATIEESYSNSMINFAMDVNSDGWLDFIRVGFPGTDAFWYENPKNNPGHWKKHFIFNAVGNESARFIDVDKDGREDLICGDSETNQMIWLKSPTQKDSTTWKKYLISLDSVPGTKRFAHGLGFVDLNSDGRSDVLIPEGWWEGPEDPTQSNWTFHPTALGQPCAQIEMMDVDGDGDEDLITSSAHKRGVWWQERVDLENWKEHLITDECSQTHALQLIDLNADGRRDIITGKRYLASRGSGEGAHEPAQVLWIEFTGKVEQPWVVHQIDDDSGVGVHFVVRDINGDGLLDVLTANKKGVFFFVQSTQ
jgi:hypothetical protein